MCWLLPRAFLLKRLSSSEKPFPLMLNMAKYFKRTGTKTHLSVQHAAHKLEITSPATHHSNIWVTRRIHNKMTQIVNLLRFKCPPLKQMSAFTAITKEFRLPYFQTISESTHAAKVYFLTSVTNTVSFIITSHTLVAVIEPGNGRTNTWVSVTVSEEGMGSLDLFLNVLY
jgi:hypothetical protein